MEGEKDFLDQIIEERTARNPNFPQLVEAELHRRELLRELTAERKARGLSRSALAARMAMSQADVARIEAGDTDTRLSVLERYAAAVDKRLEWRLVNP